MSMCQVIMVASGACIVCHGAACGSVVTLEVASAANGKVITPGESVSWSLVAAISPDDSMGLALVIADLIQAPENPAPIELVPARDVPSGMGAFSRPLGICNPGPGGVGSAYGGTPISDSGTDLFEIGGAQNTFGVVGIGVGESTTVQTGVGQRESGQVIASGSFAAPSTFGAYCVLLSSGVANVLEATLGDGLGWQTASATVVYSQQALSFQVGVPGDLDGDGVVAGADLGLLLGAWGACSGCPQDFNGDGFVDGADLGILLGNWSSGASVFAAATSVPGAVSASAGETRVAGATSTQADASALRAINGLSVALHADGSGGSVVPGAVLLSGPLVVSFEDGFMPDGQSELDLLVADAISGRFRSEMLPPVREDMSLQVRYEAQRVVLVSTIGVLGDLDHDGQVDAADLGLLLQNWGGAGDGDIDGNGVVDGDDLERLLRSIGRR